MRVWSALGALNALCAIGLGAFGAHGLRSRLAPDLLAVFETGARYHMYHALGLIAVAWLATQRGSSANVPGIFMLAGILLFSGSLYVLAISGVRSFGAVTPFGGLAFMIGWASFAWVVLRG